MGRAARRLFFRVWRPRATRALDSSLFLVLTAVVFVGADEPVELTGETAPPYSCGQHQLHLQVELVVKTRPFYSSGDFETLVEAPAAECTVIVKTSIRSHFAT